ncbi:MAG TPA: CPBP family intramembrane metalloprotease [Clostridiales bacterium]|nr:CPBP family intramembrane metalloprotease [Clostridiales bacterium]
MKRVVWKEVSAFLAVTFGVTWLFWFGASFDFAPVSAYLIMTGTAVPSVVGLIFTIAFGGKPELKSLLRSALRLKAPRIWWSYATLLFPGILLCACAIFTMKGCSLPPAQFPIWFLPLAFFYIFACMGPLGEELGWRGFLLKRLLSQWNPIKAGGRSPGYPDKKWGGGPVGHPHVYHRLHCKNDGKISEAFRAG